MTIAPRPLPDDAVELHDRLDALIRDGFLRTSARQVRHGDVVYVQGEPGQSVYLVRHGEFKRLVHTGLGRDPIVEIHVPGDVFGETCAVDRSRPDSVVAMTDGSVLTIPLESVMEAVRVSPGFGVSWNDYLCSRIRTQQEIITQFVSLESKDRLAVRLAMLGRRLIPDGDDRVVLPSRLTHDDLAAVVGTTRSRIGVFLREFEAAGLIERVDRQISYHPGRLTDRLDRRSSRGGSTGRPLPEAHRTRCGPGTAPRPANPGPPERGRTVPRQRTGSTPHGR